MNIGDKVRMLHAKEEGVVTRFLDNKLVEVEIEDGFRIPVLKSELAIISTEENLQFQKEKSKDSVKSPAKDITASKGIYMAFLLINDTNLALYLVNNTDLDVPYTIGEVEQENYKGLQGGVLKRRSSVKVHEVTTKNFEHWPAYLLQMLFFKEDFTYLQEPLTKKVRFRVNSF